MQFVYETETLDLLLNCRYADIIINYFQDVAASLIIKAALLATVSATASATASDGSSTTLLPQKDSAALQAHLSSDGVGSFGTAAWEEGVWTGARAAAEVPSAVPHAISSAVPSASQSSHAACTVEGSLGVSYLVYCSTTGLKPPFFLVSTRDLSKAGSKTETAGVCASMAHWP